MAILLERKKRLIIVKFDYYKRFAYSVGYALRLQYEFVTVLINDFCACCHIYKLLYAIFHYVIELSDRYFLQVKKFVIGFWILGRIIRLVLTYSRYLRDIGFCCGYAFLLNNLFYLASDFGAGFRLT